MHTQNQFQDPVCQALHLQSLAAWRSLDNLKIPLSDLNVTSHSALLNALCFNPFKQAEEEGEDLKLLFQMAPVSACAISLSRSFMLLGIEHIIANRQLAAETALKKALALSLEAVVAAGVVVPTPLYEQFSSSVCNLLDALSSQTDLAFAIERQQIPAQLIFVLGMHRSGTSALAGLLVASGMEGPEDLMPATINNPKGYYESTSIMQLNDWLLSELGSSWSNLEPISESSWLHGSESITAWRRRLLDVLHRAYKSGSSAVIKDPRFCLLIRALVPWFESSLLPFFFILPVRHPAEVVESLYKAEGISRTRCLKLWFRYLLGSERFTRGVPRLIVSYDELVSNPEVILSAFHQMFANYTTESFSPLNIGATAFIDPQLHRQQVSPDLPDWVSHADLNLAYDSAIHLYSMFTNKALSDQELRSGLDASWRQWQTLLAHSF
jgi:hypothetical protein